MPRHLPSSIRARLGAALLALCALAAARAGDGQHIFWSVKGAHNTVYLLGSVHLLEPGDSATPPAALQAYERSPTLVMELDLNDADTQALLGSVDTGSLPPGQTLRDALGPELYGEFAAQAARLGLAPELTDQLRPWMAALLLEQLALARSGFDANSGVDMQFAQRARADHKPIVALETAAEQIGFFARLSAGQQRQFLRSTLRDLATEGSDAKAVVAAWRRGDTQALERLLHKDAADAPELFRSLTVERNRNWLPRIIALLHDDRDALVIVGAMHLIGDEGLVELLRRRGYDPVQH